MWVWVQMLVGMRLRVRVRALVLGTNMLQLVQLASGL
jgi:hypothetical protein